MTSFKSLGLPDQLVQATEAMGFTQPTEIQEKAIPQMLTSEADLLALAQTGTGKTAAFGLPLLSKIDPSQKFIQGLILAPTRELCLQIHRDLADLSRFMKKVHCVAVYGGANINEQIKQLRKGAHIIVATPGRMKDLMRRKKIDISRLQICVLDEADEMLNMGFYEDLQDILSHTPQEKTTWLFSATMPKQVSKIARKFMHDPYEITVGNKNEGTSLVSHECYMIRGNQRYNALKRLVDAHPNIFGVVFCKTKRTTQSTAEKLMADGYNANAIHGDLSQNQRDMVMNAFRKRQLQILVATDVAARGIDVDNITHVINYQLPDEVEVYTHRSGRTGRAGSTGVSIVIATTSERRKIKQIEKKIGQQLEMKTLPTGKEICKSQLLHLAEKVRDSSINPDIKPYMDNISHLFEDISKEELIEKLFSVEFSRFANYYKHADFPSNQAGKGKQNHGNGGAVRYFINVGKRDGFSWQSLKDLLKDELNLTSNELFKVDVENSFSFFNTDAEYSDKVLAHFKGYQMQGRKINVEISEETHSTKRRKKKGGGRRKNFRKGRKNHRRR